MGYSYTESKFALEFISEANDIKDIPLDTTMAVSMKKSTTRFFQINNHFESYFKISRNAGFPYIAKKICNPINDMEKCLEDFRQGDDKGEQLVNKIMTVSEKPCISCMLYIKITA